MQINLSDETLDHLRFHLDVLVKLYQKQYKVAKRENARVSAMARLGEVRDLAAIFEVVEPATPKADADFIVTQQGSVFTFDINTEAALAFVHSDVKPEAWQFLGKHRFAVEHRVAPELCYQLREAGWNVVVR